MLRRLMFGIVVVFLALGLNHNAKASLLGQTVTCLTTLDGCETEAVVVAGTPEFTLFELGIPLFSIDVEDSSYKITNITGVGGTVTFSFDLGDLFWSEDPGATIKSVVLTEKSFVFGDPIILVGSNVVRTAFLNVDFLPFGFYSFTIIPDHQEVPEPATFWLFSLGLALVFWWTRQARSVARGHEDRHRHSPNTATA